METGERPLDILEQCDQHKKQLLTFCKKESTVLCSACLPNHVQCKEEHKAIEEFETAHIISKLNNSEKVITKENVKFVAICNDIKSRQQTNDNIRNAVGITAAIERIMNSIAKLKNATNAIQSQIGKDETPHLHLRWLSVATVKSEQVEKEVNKIKIDISELQDCLKKQTQNMVALQTQSEGHKRPKPTENTEDQTQEQLLIKKQRQEEASKEMLYRVYGNVIAMLEEYEGRKDGKQMPKSKIDISDQSWKTDEDVQANVESQLVVFEAQLKACPTKVSSELKKEFRINTIYWAATRAERMASRFSETDRYIAQVYEILVDGRTHHQIFDEKREKLSRETANNTVSAFFAGKHTASEIDKKYESDPSQKASPPQIRTTSGGFKMLSGAERIHYYKPHLSFALDDDVCLVTGIVR